MRWESCCSRSARAVEGHAERDARQFLFRHKFFRKRPEPNLFPFSYLSKSVSRPSVRTYSSWSPLDVDKIFDVLYIMQQQEPVRFASSGWLVTIQRNWSRKETRFCNRVAIIGDASSDFPRLAEARAAFFRYPGCLRCLRHEDSLSRHTIVAVVVVRRDTESRSVCLSIPATRLKTDDNGRRVYSTLLTVARADDSVIFSCPLAATGTRSDVWRKLSILTVATINFVVCNEYVCQWHISWLRLRDP